MDDLPKQQQEIVEVIALSWSAVNVKEIRQKTRMESKMISDQLTHLVKNGIINRILTTTKNHLYQLNDRFFNIWYLMRYGRKGHKKEVILLVRFFELWCEKKEVIVERVQKQINQLKSGNFEEAEKKIINAIEIAKNKETEIEAHLDGLIGVFLFLLQRRKYKELLAFFHDEKADLKTPFQPIYYALLYFIQDEYPTDYLRMGRELEETVGEIVGAVEDLN